MVRRLVATTALLFGSCASHRLCAPCWGLAPCLEDTGGQPVESQQLRLFTDSVLCVGTPVGAQSGFWVRVLSVLAHAKIALAAGLQVATCGRQTGYDLYTNTSCDDCAHLSWDSFFRPIGSAVGRRTVQLSCHSAAEAWPLVRYRETHEDLVDTRAWMVETAYTHIRAQTTLKP